MTFILTSTTILASTSLVIKSPSLQKRSCACKTEGFAKTKFVQCTALCKQNRRFCTQCTASASCAQTSFVQASNAHAFLLHKARLSTTPDRLSKYKKDLVIRQFKEKDKQLHFELAQYPVQNSILEPCFGDILSLLKKKQYLHFYPQGQKYRNSRMLWYLNDRHTFLLPQLIRSHRKTKLWSLLSMRNNVLYKRRSSLVPLFYQSLFANNNFYQLNDNKKIGSLYSTNLDKMSFLSSDLANLGLSLKTYTFLKQQNIHKIGNLVQYSEKDLLQLFNRDKNMFTEVQRCSLLIPIY